MFFRVRDAILEIIEDNIDNQNLSLCSLGMAENKVLCEFMVEYLDNCCIIDLSRSLARYHSPVRQSRAEFSDTIENALGEFEQDWGLSVAKSLQGYSFITNAICDCLIERELVLVDD